MSVQPKSEKSFFKWLSVVRQPKGITSIGKGNFPSFETTLLSSTKATIGQRHAKLCGQITRRIRCRHAYYFQPFFDAVTQGLDKPARSRTGSKSDFHTVF